MSLSVGPELTKGGRQWMKAAAELSDCSMQPDSTVHPTLWKKAAEFGSPVNAGLLVET